MPNKFIVFEGIDGSGKSTQIQKIFNWFQGHTPEIYFTREPYDKDLTNCVRGKCFDPVSQTLVFLADRNEHSKLIKEALSHSHVISDRYDWSTQVYQIRKMKEDLRETFENFAKLCKNGVKPQAYLYFKIDVATYRKRKPIPSDQLEKSVDVELEEMLNAYNELANYKKQFYNVYDIDATKPEPEVFDQVLNALMKEGIIRL